MNGRNFRHRLDKVSRKTHERFSVQVRLPGAGSGARRARHGDIFPAGSLVRESGIYEVLHEGEHRSAHEVVMIAEDLFPQCDGCQGRVRYRVVRTAPYIFSDEDFEEPLQ